LGRVIVAGVGNVLLRDEGVGVRVVEALRGTPLPEGVELMEVGTALEALLALPEGVEKLVVVDAMRAGFKPGTVLRLKIEDLRPLRAKVSLHEAGLPEILGLLWLSGRGPREVVVLGVEAKEVGFGEGLSPEVEARLPEIMAKVMEEVQDVGR